MGGDLCTLVWIMPAYPTTHGHPAAAARAVGVAYGSQSAQK